MIVTLKTYLTKFPIWVWAIISGVCLGIGFIIPLLSPLVILGILINLKIVVSNLSAKKIVKLITLAWLVKYSFSIFYFWSTFPLDFMGITSVPLELSIIGFYWATSCLWLSFGGTLFSSITIFLSKKKNYPKAFWYIVVPVLWTVGEWFGAVSFSFFTLGPGSTVQDYFSFGMIGYQLTYWSGTLNLAQIYGIYGLTFILVSFTVLLFFILQTKKGLKWWLVLGLILGGLLFNDQTPVYKGKQITAYVIDTKYTLELYKSDAPNSVRIKDLDQAVQTALKDKPDFVILPEDSRYFMYKYPGFDNSELVNLYMFMHSTSSTVLIDSSRNDSETGKTVLRANVLDGRSRKIYNFDKQYLVPQGEYVPYIYGLIMREFGYGDLVDKISRDSSYRIGEDPVNENIPNYLPGILFCFESVQNNAVSNLLKDRPLPFVAHLVSHSWFRDSGSLERELDTMLKVQAVYNQTPIVSAAHVAQGKLYLPSGEIKLGEVVESSDLHTIKKFEF